ncbi:MAG: hypothetical protein AAF826_04245 [Pseudomonadota bacterium]
MRFVFPIFAMVLLAGCVTKEAQPITQRDSDAINFPTAEVTARVDSLLPKALAENRAMEARALRVGTPLTAEGIDLARKLGVKSPEKVRVVVVKKIPKSNTADRLIKAQPLLSLSATIAGLTAGYGIYLDDGYEDKIWVLAHELVHVAQFERYGLESLTRRVITEQVALPGRLIPIEREAIQTSSRVLGITPPAYAF